MADKMPMLDIKTDIRLMEWLLSNPVGEVYSYANPVMGVEYETFRTTHCGKVVPHETGFRRWPIVPTRDQ